MVSDRLLLTAALAVGLTLLVSGAGKLRDPRRFVSAVIEYRVLPRRWAIPYGWAVPALEIACGVALLVGFWPVLFGLGAGILLASFLVGVSPNLLRGRQLSCYCFGRSEEPLGWTNLVRLFIVLGLVAVVIARGDGGLLALEPDDRLPALLLAAGVVLGLRMVGAVPAQWRVWRSQAVASPTTRVNRVSLRNQPLGLPAVPGHSNGRTTSVQD